MPIDEKSMFVHIIALRTFVHNRSRMCRTPAADVAVSLFRLVSQSVTDTDDQDWLYGRVFHRVYALIGHAHLLDPRVVYLTAEQEPHRAEIVAMVCDLCPERTSGHVHEQVWQEAALRYGDERAPVYDTPMCESEAGDTGEPRDDGRHWEGTLTIAQITIDAGPVVCEPPAVWAPDQCRWSVPPAETFDHVCHAGFIGESLPSVLGLPLTGPMEMMQLSSGTSVGDWSVSFADAPLGDILPSMRTEEDVTFEEVEGAAGVFTLEEGDRLLSGSVSGEGVGATTITGTHQERIPLQSFVHRVSRDAVCQGRVGWGQSPDDVVHITGSWSVTECDGWCER